jgi:hypothetical protein
MADIELVIKIPESTYKVFKNLSKIIGVLVYEKDILTLIKAVKNGKPLPKGHGRLIDGSKLKVELECGIKAGNYEEGYEKYAHINGMDDCIDAVEYADTIIEADKGE